MPILGYLDAFLVLFWGLLGPSWDILGASWDQELFRYPCPKITEGSSSFLVHFGDGFEARYGVIFDMILGMIDLNMCFFYIFV